MSWPVYSINLLGGSASSAPTAAALVYTVPAGKVVVVRGIDLFVDAVGWVGVARRSGASAQYIAHANGAAQWTCVQWEGYQVLNAGDQLGVDWLGGNVRVLASGHILSTV